MFRKLLSRIPDRPGRTTTIITLLIASACIACLLLYSRLGIDRVTLAFPSNTIENESLTNATFDRPSIDGVTSFAVTMRITNHAISHRALVMYPDDCIEKVSLNSVVLQDFVENPEYRKCYPAYLRLDLAGHLKPGENTLRVDISDLGKRMGLRLDRPFASYVVYALVGLSWVVIYCLLALLLEWPPCQPGSQTRDVLRQVARIFLALLAPMTAVLIALNQQTDTELWQRPLVISMAIITSTALLLRALDMQRVSPLRDRPSVVWVTFSLLATLKLALTPAADTNYGASGYFTIVLTAVISGILATTSFFDLLKRAIRDPKLLLITLIAAASPLLTFAMKLSLWEHMAKPTADMVSGILSLLGFETRSWMDIKRSEQGNLMDYHGYVTSPDFSIQIGSWCGGFEGMAFFLFLLSFFILLDWNRFKPFPHMTALFVATLAYVLFLNVARITALFVYAEVMIEEVGKGEASRRTIEAFHSHVGLVLYSVAFAPFMATVYWWERRTRITWHGITGDSKSL